MVPKSGPISAVIVIPYKTTNKIPQFYVQY